MKSASVAFSKKRAWRRARPSARGGDHTDLNPGNIMITDSVVQIHDFGLAKLGDSAEIVEDDATRTVHMSIGPAPI